MIAIWDIIYLLSWTICDRIFPGDNLTIGITEKGAEGTLNVELPFYRGTSPLSRKMRICGVTPTHL